MVQVAELSRIVGGSRAPRFVARGCLDEGVALMGGRGRKRYAAGKGLLESLTERLSAAISGRAGASGDRTLDRIQGPALNIARLYERLPWALDFFQLRIIPDDAFAFKAVSEHLGETILEYLDRAASLADAGGTLGALAESL